MTIEDVIKWTVIGGISAFSMLLIYKFGEGQGWWSFRQRLTTIERFRAKRLER